MLSGEDLRRFGEGGDLVVPGVVSEHLLSALDAEIDGLLALNIPPFVHKAGGPHFDGHTTARVRRIGYYRLSCRGHAERWEDTFLDPLTEYQPVLRRLAREGDSDE